MSCTRRPFAVRAGPISPQYLLTHNPQKGAKNPLDSEKRMESRGFQPFCQGSTGKKETGFRLSRMVREGGVEPPRPE